MLDLSKILMYEFWYDYAEAKCGEKAKLCCLDTDSFIAYVKTNDIYIYIYINTAEVVKTRFDTSNY